jgi:hypothetical protein
MLDSSGRSQNISVPRCEQIDIGRRDVASQEGGGGGTLLAGLAFSFSKIFCDCALVADILVFQRAELGNPQRDERCIDRTVEMYFLRSRRQSIKHAAGGPQMALNAIGKPLGPIKRQS